MAKIERVYNIPLRKEFLKSPRWRRTKKAVAALRKFLARHMKSDNIKIGKYLNIELWKHGIRNPPHHVKVNVVKDDDGIVTAELVGAPLEKAEEKKEGKAAEKAEKEEPKEKTTQEKPANAKKAGKTDKETASATKTKKDPAQTRQPAKQPKKDRKTSKR
ncbi:MAG: 50S ribosomal protein L31e [archaeon]